MKNRTLFYLCLFAFLFFSCDFGIKNNYSQENQEIITVKGICKINGVVPSKMIENNNSSRTVVPSLNVNDFKYEVLFKNGEKTQTVEAVVKNEQIVFEVGLTSGTWTIQGLGKFTDGKTVLQSEEITKEISKKDDSIELFLKPICGTEKGVVSFSFGTISNSINKIKCTYTKDGVTNSCEITDFANSFTMSLDSGVYDFRFVFYSDSIWSDEIVYSFSEVVNVFDGLTSDTWINSGKHLNSEGKIEITDELINEFKLTTIYVDSEKGSDENDGSYLGPYKTMQNAIDKIISNNEVFASSSASPYRIYLKSNILRVSDFVGVSIKPKDELEIRNYFLSINPQGTTNELWLEVLSVDENQKEINAAYTEETMGGVLYINNANIKLENIKIIGGYLGQNDGAGIYIDKNAKIDIVNCEISGNKIQNTNGAGVYVSSGATFNVGGLIKIKGNKTKVGTEEKENNVYLCDEAKLSFISGLSEGSEIGITTQTTPLYWSPVEIASKSSFDTVMPDKNINSYVKSDVVGFGINGVFDSYSLVPSGGEISVVFAGFDSLNRTAYPAEPSVLEYKVIATNQEGKNIEGKSNINTNEYSIELPVGKWNLKIDGLDSEGKTILTKTETIEVLSENYYATKNVEIKEISNSGTGDINLRISIPSKYENANALIELKKESGSINQIVNIDERTTTNKVGTLNLQNIPAGKYTMTVKLYDENINEDFTTNGILLYTFKDNDVNIYDNLLTNQWDSTNYKNNVLEITDEKIKEQVTTNYYVSESGNDSLEGTQELPFASIRRGMECANKIYGYFTDINDFTFYLTGAIVENKPVVISNGLNIEIKKDATTTETPSVQKGATFTGSVLIDVETGGTLLISGITIDGGNAVASTNVSGIKVLGTLTLKNVIIQNCESAANGAGVYVSSGAAFNVGGLVKIKGNKTKVGTEEKENNVYLCDEAKLSFISGLSEGSEIGITTQTTPLYWSPVEIASKLSFDTVMPDKKINSYVKSDVMGLGIKGVFDSYSLVPSGGNIEIGEIPNLQICLNETSSSENIILSEPLEVSITAMLDGKIIDFDSSNLPTITVYNHGSLAQSTISGNTYTISNDWPKDEIYQFVVSCVYEGITYTETFTVCFENELEDE